MNKEFKLNLNASDYAISHCDSDKTYNGLEVHKMLCDAYIAGTNDDEAYRKAYYDGYNKCNRDWIHSQEEQKASYTTLVETGDGGINALVTRELHTDGEQKSIDKVEPKFKVGDWIAYNHNPNLSPKKIIQITNQHYVFADCSFEIKTLETDWHLWTIQDAKEGDIIVDNDQNIGLFKVCSTLKSFPTWESYFYIGMNHIYRMGGVHLGTESHPATLEQRKHLNEVLCGSGYWWDNECKTLCNIPNIGLEDGEKTCKGVHIHKECPNFSPKWELTEFDNKVIDLLDNFAAQPEMPNGIKRDVAKQHADNLLAIAYRQFLKDNPIGKEIQRRCDAIDVNKMAHEKGATTRVTQHWYEFGVQDAIRKIKGDCV